MDQNTQPSPGPPPFRIVPDYDDNDPLVTAKRTTGAFSLADATPGDVPWLWTGRIPLGGVTLLVSDPGLGKSLLALDIAARASRGAEWPDAVGPPSRGGQDPACTVVGPPSQGGQISATDKDPASAARLAAPTSQSSNPQSAIRNPQSTPGSVLLINVEDHFLYTIRPRLDALGADCSRIIGWTLAGGGLLDPDELHLFALTHDLDRLEKLIEAMRDCRLVILDPITALVGDSSGKSSADAWKLLAVLARLARRHSFAVLAVSHLRKKQGSLIHRALGSLAFVAAARSVWTIAKDTDDPQKRLLLPVKNNLAPHTPGLVFVIETSPANGAAAIRWLPGTAEANAETAVASARPPGRPNEERQAAIQWLRQHLAQGMRPMMAVRRAAEANGIAFRTLCRAYSELGGKSIQRSTILGRQWFWTIPASECQNPGEEIWHSDRLTTDQMAELLETQ
jgi:hypothetical protein